MLLPGARHRLEYEHIQQRQDSETTTETEDPPTSTPTDSGTTTTTDPPETTPTSDPPTTPPPTTTRPPTTPGPPPTTPRPGTSTSISYGSHTISLPGGGITTIITSVIVVDGQTVTTVVPGPSQTSTDSGGGNNNIGTIVGASVGGAIAVALIGLLWFILARKARERRHKAFENDIFNPDHGTRGPNFDLGGGPDPETIPDPYQLEPQQMQQHQYPGYNGYPAPIATGGYAATGPAHPLSPHGSNPYYDAQSATSGGTAPGLAGVGVAGALGAGAYMHNRHSGTPTTGDGGSTGSTDHASVQPLTGRQAKEREAFARSQRMSMPPGPAGPGSPVLAPGMLSPTHTGNASNAAYNYGMGPAPPTTSSVYSTDSGAPGSPIRSQHGHAQAFPGGFGVVNPDHVPRTSTPGGGVVVHQDAGRVPQHEEQDGHDEGEIPPTYDSIPVGDRPAAASAEPPRPISAASGGRPSISEARPGSATSNRLETDQRPHAI